MNNALNDLTYVPHLLDQRAWCQGYMAGVNSDMIAWAPLTAAKPDLLKMIMAGADEVTLAGVAKLIHAFWLEKRQGGTGVDLLGQLAVLAPGHLARSHQHLH